jgi:hypothetical protein
LGWFKWKSLELFESWHSQAKLCFSLGLVGNIFLILHIKYELLNLFLSPPFAPFQYLMFGVSFSKVPSP